MHIIALGMNHQTAPIEMRERLALTEETQGQVLHDLYQLPAVGEVVVLSTCNRLEIYAAVTAFHEAIEGLVALLADHSHMDATDLMSLLYIHHHHQAARHLFRVTCGLDAMILGETQILGQVRDAYHFATGHGTVGKLLHELFQRALRVGKRAHTETAISRSAASISSAAVQLVRDRIGDLAGCQVLVVGAGEMAELSAQHLRDLGATQLFFANRTQKRAAELAASHGGRSLPLSEVASALETADIALVSTASTDHVLTLPMMQEVMRKRNQEESQGPLLIIDISVPRNVDPRVGLLPGVVLHDIDALQTVVADNLRQRELETPKVEAIIRNEVSSFNNWLRELEIVPLIRSLRKKAEEIRRAEMQRLLDRLPNLDSNTREMMELTTQSIVNKILNEPTVRLKESVTDAQGDLYAQALASLFNLSPTTAEPVK